MNQKFLRLFIKSLEKKDNIYTQRQQVKQEDNENE